MVLICTSLKTHDTEHLFFCLFLLFHEVLACGSRKEVRQGWRSSPGENVVGSPEDNLGRTVPIGPQGQGPR